MIYIEKLPGSFERWNGERLADGILLNPADALRLSDQELADLDLYRPVPAAPVPDGMIVVATRVERIDGVVQIVQDLETAVVDLPPLTRRQLRLALLSIGVTAEDVEVHIADIPDPIERAAAMIEWEDATHYKRDHPLVADVAVSMALPAEQVDALWVWAAGL